MAVRELPAEALEAVRGIEDKLLPVPWEKRVLPAWSYMAMFWSIAIAVHIFAFGSWLVFPAGPLNFTQAVVVVIVGAAVTGVILALGGSLGVKAGIPFAVQTHYSFGEKGCLLAQIIRFVPAIGWLGIGTWVGVLALNAITTALFGWGNTILYFVLLTLIQVAFAWKGIIVAKWVMSSMGLVLVAFMVYFVVALAQAGRLEMLAGWGGPGTWGLPFWALITTASGYWSTVALSNSDLTRHLKVRTQGGNFAIHQGAMFAPLVFIYMMGITAMAVSGGVYTDPVAALMGLAPSTALGLSLIFFILLAQVSTNFGLNILPPALIFQDFFKKLSWKGGIVIACLLSLVTFPWILLTAEWYYTFINIYSAFIAPMIVVLAMDFWWGKRGLKNLDEIRIIKEIYGVTRRTYRWGVSWDGILTTVIGAIVAYMFLSYAFWVGALTAFVVYLVIKGLGGIDARVSGLRAQV